MIRCSRCVMPNTRPDTPFIEGVCQACINYANRPQIDWHQRGIELIELLDRHHGECIVPSSGGKDSTAQVMKLLGLGASVTVVTATTCHLTPLGRANIDNLARHAKTIEVTLNRTVRAKLNRLGMEMVGDISWPEHVAIFTTPFKVANDMRIPLMFYGENPQDQYGGPVGSEQAVQMTQRWRSEFGGFLGLRPSDIQTMGYDMRDYTIPNELLIVPEAHFLGAYLPWDSHHNAEVAMKAGMWAPNPGNAPSIANWWPWENLDNAQTGLHDHMMFRKYGYGRGCAQLSVDVRTGRISRETAMIWVEKFDGRYPYVYAGVPIEDVLERIQVTKEQLWDLLDRYTNWDIFSRTDHNADGVPKFK